MSTHRRTTHRRPAAGRRAGVVLAGLALLVLTVSGAMAPANAAKGGNGGGKPGGGGGKPGSGTASLSLVMVDPADAVANHGDQVTFDASASATTEPNVQLKCYQGGDMVYTQQTGYYDGYPWPWTQTMTLSSGAWTSGAADCTAALYYFNGSKTVTAATLDFHVQP